MINVDQALAHMLAAVTRLNEDHDSEIISLYSASKRVLAQDIIAGVNVPPADNSAMDGYAVRTADFKDFDKITGLSLPLSQRIAAGDQAKPLKPKSAARVFTGSEIPVGADAVVMQENCVQESAERVTILCAPKAHDNIRRCGQDIRDGNCIAEKGSSITPQLAGHIAAVGKAKVKVFRPLKIALLATGNELIEPGRPLKPGQIYNSNQAMLSLWLEQLGCDIVCRELVKDSLSATVEAIRSAAACADLIVSSGGVSVGEEDHVKRAIEELGELNLWKVAMKPGKPIAFGRVDQAVFLGLPGNPVSSFVTFMLFALPLIKTMCGEQYKPSPTSFLPANFSSKAQRRREFCRVQVLNGRLEKYPNQSSGVLSSVCWADGLACIPENTEIHVGDVLEVFPFNGFLS